MPGTTRSASWLSQTAMLNRLPRSNILGSRLPKWLPRTRFVALTNEGARELGYPDAGALWRSKSDMPQVPKPALTKIGS